MLQINMEDKYYDESVLEQICKILNLSKISYLLETDEPDYDLLMSVINISFVQLMKIYLESHQCPVSPANITMELFN